MHLLVGRVAHVVSERVISIVEADEEWRPAEGEAVPLLATDNVSPGDHYAAGQFALNSERVQRDAAAAQAEAARQAERAQRRAALRALRDGSGDLTARQLTQALRLLAREVLGDA